MKESVKVPMTMQMHTRPTEGSNMKMIRSDMVMKGIHISQFVGYCDEFEKQQTENPSVIKLEIFEKKDGNCILYS